MRKNKWTKEQFEKETDFQLAMSIFRGMYRKGLISLDQLKQAAIDLDADIKPPMGAFGIEYLTAGEVSSQALGTGISE